MLSGSMDRRVSAASVIIWMSASSVSAPPGTGGGSRVNRASAPPGTGGGSRVHRASTTPGAGGGSRVNRASAEVQMSTRVSRGSAPTLGAAPGRSSRSLSRVSVSPSSGSGVMSLRASYVSSDGEAAAVAAAAVAAAAVAVGVGVVVLGVTVVTAGWRSALASLKSSGFLAGVWSASPSGEGSEDATALSSLSSPWLPFDVFFLVSGPSLSFLSGILSPFSAFLLAALRVSWGFSGGSSSGACRSSFALPSFPVSLAAGVRLPTGGTALHLTSADGAFFSLLEVCGGLFTSSLTFDLDAFSVTLPFSVTFDLR